MTQGHNDMKTRAVVVSSMLVPSLVLCLTVVMLGEIKHRRSALLRYNCLNSRRGQGGIMSEPYTKTGV